MRARAYCLRDAYPDLLKGLGVVEERQDHDDSPPPITNYELAQPEPQPAIEDQSQDEVTLASVKHAMRQSDDMEALLKAANMAKQLSDADQAEARVVYREMRDALLDTEQIK